MYQNRGVCVPLKHHLLFLKKNTISGLFSLVSFQKFYKSFLNEMRNTTIYFSLLSFIYLIDKLFNSFIDSLINSYSCIAFSWQILPPLFIIIMPYDVVQYNTYKYYGEILENIYLEFMYSIFLKIYKYDTVPFF